MLELRQRRHDREHGPAQRSRGIEERLIALLKKERDQPSAKLIDSIKADVSSFTDAAAAADDITIVVARRL
jgi:serine phosphatase RsbU (regulator of sigma subunit)